MSFALANKLKGAIKLSCQLHCNCHYRSLKGRLCCLFRDGNSVIMETFVININDSHEVIDHFYFDCIRGLELCFAQVYLV